VDAGPEDAIDRLAQTSRRLQAARGTERAADLIERASASTT
jgi:hypothetical protein